MKRILKCSLDKFYTKVDLVDKLISKIDFNEYDLVLDPCCGDGAFFSRIDHKNKIGIDISPNIEGVIKHDFLTWDYSNINGKTISISNPPFGKQGSLALKFIKRCSEFSDTIAFILPLSFSKPSLKNKVPLNLHLNYEEILPDNSFLLNGEDYNVKCVFQIWEKRNYKRDKIIGTDPIGFKYTKDRNLSDISIRRVGVYAGRAFKDNDRSEQSHYFIILQDKSKIDNLVSLLNSTEWVDLTVGPRSISKSELNEVINSIM